MSTTVGHGPAAAPGQIVDRARAAIASWPPSPLRISVVIPTFRRPDLIVRCLEALVAQELDTSVFEVIVVDDGRTAETQAAVNAFARRHAGAPAIRYTRPGRGKGPAAARNWGWRLARAEIIAFTDDDTIPDRRWLLEGERALGPQLAAVSGRVQVPPLTDACARPLPPTDHALMTQGLETAEFVTANAFVRRPALIGIGGFDERFERAWREDSDLQFMLMENNERIARCAEAVVVHPVRPERWGVSLRQQKNVYFDALLFKKHPSLYRERILASPPWHYYAIVALIVAAAVLWRLDIPGSAITSLAIALVLVLRFALRRLRATSHAPGHVLEMLVTSACIPFLSIYWRLRGALRFRVLYL